MNVVIDASIALDLFTTPSQSPAQLRAIALFEAIADGTKRPPPGHNLTYHKRRDDKPPVTTAHLYGWGGSVQQGLSDAGGAFGFY